MICLLLNIYVNSCGIFKNLNIVLSCDSLYSEMDQKTPRANRSEHTRCKNIILPNLVHVFLLHFCSAATTPALVGEELSIKYILHLRVALQIFSAISYTDI